MNNNYWSNWSKPTLSEKLEKLGCESQFDFHTCDVDQELHEASGTCYGKFKKAYHWSDLCLPENAKKIWGNIEVKNHSFSWKTICFEEKIKTLVDIIFFDNGKFEEWLEEEVDKKLKEI